MTEWPPNWASARRPSKHREPLRQKLDVHDPAGFTRYAIGAGVIESSVQLTIVSGCGWTRWADFVLVVVRVIEPGAAFTTILDGVNTP